MASGDPIVVVADCWRSADLRTLGSALSCTWRRHSRHGNLPTNRLCYSPRLLFARAVLGDFNRSSQCVRSSTSRKRDRRCRIYCGRWYRRIFLDRADPADCHGFPAVTDPLADIPEERDGLTMSGDHWTYKQWEDGTVEKIVTMGLLAPEEHRADYLRVQIRRAIRQSLRHGRSGRSEDDPVVA